MHPPSRHEDRMTCRPKPKPELQRGARRPKRLSVLAVLLPLPLLRLCGGVLMLCCCLDADYGGMAACEDQQDVDGTAWSLMHPSAVSLFVLSVRRQERLDPDFHVWRLASAVTPGEQSTIHHRATAIRWASATDTSQSSGSRILCRTKRYLDEEQTLSRVHDPLAFRRNIVLLSSGKRTLLEHSTAG